MGPEDLKLSDEFKIGLEYMEYMSERLEDRMYGLSHGPSRPF